MEKQIKIPKYLNLIAAQRAEFRMRVSLSENLIGTPATANLQSFNPQSVDEIFPKAEDYLRATFRALSARYLGESGYFLDFSRPGVLMQSIPLMLPRERGGSRRDYLKFHRNHTEAIEARIGWVDAASWSEAGGSQTTAGINVETMIDWRLAPNEARQLLSTPPLVDSVSMSLIFDWEKSHPGLTDWQFWEMLGHDVDDDIVRIIVTEIMEYRHIGLVTEGADEEADMIRDENELRRDEMPAIELEKQPGGHTMQKNLQLTEVQANELAGILEISEPMTPELLADTIAALAAAKNDLAAQISGLKIRAEALAAAHNDLVAQISGLKIKAEAFDKILSDKRARVSALLVKLEEKPSNAMLQAIKMFDFAELVELENDYQAKLDAKFRPRCQKCGSLEIERRSSVEVDRTIGDSSDNVRGARVDENKFKLN